MREENPKSPCEDLSDKGMARWLFEGAMARLERSNKRLFILAIILTLLLFITNFSWVVYECQYAVTESMVIQAEQEADDNGSNYIVGGDYGKAESKGNEDPHKNP